MIKTSLQEFLAAHTTKWDKVLIYDWELANLTSAIDSSLADKWYDATQDYIDYNEYTLQLHGDILRVTIPVFSVQEELNDITQEYREWLSDYLKDWLLSDRKWAILFKLLDSFSVSEKDWRLAFATLWDVSDKILKTVKVNQVSIGDFKTDITITASNEITRYENIILLFKEVSDWYYDVRKHSIVDKVGWQYQQQEYTLGRDIIAKINTKTREVIEVTQIDTEYASRKDKDWWYVIKPDGTEESTSTFLPYKSTIDGDITTLEFYWAYTHVLRDLLDFKPLTWQYKYLLNENRINFLATARRAWKTRYIAYAIARWLWKMPNSNKHVQRQIKLLYTAPSEDKQKEVIDYIKSSWERIRLLKVLDFNKKENRLYLYDEVIGRNQKIANVVASCDFVSAKGFEPWRGKASDEIFIDEASITPEDTWLNLLPIIGNERAKVVCVWTIDWSTRKQWFYSSLIESERWVDVEQFGMRVTIDDLDEAHVPLIDRDRMKRMFINNKDRYYAELYATFPDNNSVFNSEWFFSINKDRPPGEKIGGYIIWYDPAKRTDIWAVEVAEYRINNAWQTYVQIIEEHSLRGEYTEQKNVLASIKQRYMDASYWAPVYVVIDATQVWDVVAEMFGDIVNYKVWYTAKGKRPTIDAYGAWKVPKNHLVHLSQILMEKWIMKGWVGLKELIEELRNFKAIDTAAGNVKYEAEVGHDDHVNAMMLIGFYVGYIDWKVYEFAVDWDISRGEWITDEWLYESTTTRWVTNILESVYWVWYKFWV